MDIRAADVLEDHGFNSEIFLFGDSHDLLKSWLALNLLVIEGIVGTFNFSAPSLRGQVALISSGEQTEARCPDETFFCAIKSKAERSHVRALARAIADLTRKQGFLEASFIGGGYHIDFVRENYAIFEGDEVMRFEPRPSSTYRMPSVEDGPSKIKSRIQEAKFGVVVQGIDGLIVSINKEGNLLIAHELSQDGHPSYLALDEDGLHAHDEQELLLFSVKSAELVAELGKVRSDTADVIVFNSHGVQNCRRLPIQ